MKNKKEYFEIKAIIAMTIICCLLASTVSIAEPVGSEVELEKYSRFGFVDGVFDNTNTYRYTSNTSSIKNIIRWDGNEWHTLGKGRNASALALTTYGENLSVGGLFDGETGGSCPPTYINDSIIIWYGNSWSLMTPIGNPLIAFIFTETIWNEDLYVGGFFFGESGIHHLARYEGNSWSEVGGGTYHPDYLSDVLTLNVFDDRLVVGGRFKWVEEYEGILANGLALWDGSSWDPIGVQTVRDRVGANIYTSSCVIGDDLYVAGRFMHEVLPDTFVKNLAVYGNYGPEGALGWSDEQLITDIDIGNAGMILTVEEYNGDLVVGGFFTEINGVPVNHIARWDGNQWHAFDGGMTGDDPVHTRVHDIIVYNGELIAGGCFNSAGNSSAKNIAKWDGSSWSEIGNDIVDVPFVEDLWHGVWAMEEYNGDLIVAGNFIDDTIPPETTCTLLGEMHNNVYISNVTVLLEATDDMSGVNRTMYKVDDGEWDEYEISFTITEEGTHTVYYYSVDNDDNVEPVKTTNFTIDFNTSNPQPELDVEISGGLGIDVTISNIGDGDAIDIDWTVNIEGGLFVNPRNSSDTIDSLSAGEYETVHIDIFGIGLGFLADTPIITATANTDGADEIEESIEARIFFTTVVQI